MPPTDVLRCRDSPLARRREMHRGSRGLEDLDLDCLHAHRDAPCVPRRLPRVLREERRRLVQVSESTRIMSVSDMHVVRQR